MKVLVHKPVVLEALEGSIVEVSSRQYELVKNYCDLVIPSVEVKEHIETKEISKSMKQTRKGKK